MKSLKDKVVAITGAGSGIGRSLAQKAVARGAHVALSDVNEGSLDETAQSLSSAGTKVTAHVVDVRKREAMFEWAATCEAEHGGVDAIINNAGVTARWSIEEMPYEQLEMVIDVCLWGVIHGVKAFLPRLRKRPEGHIVNISSINAFVPFSKNGPYNAAKAAVLGLSETLMMELQGHPIRVTVVHPGGIKTNIGHNSPGVTQEAADAFKRYVGADAKFMQSAKRLIPAATVAVSGRLSDRFG